MIRSFRKKLEVRYRQKIDATVEKLLSEPEAPDLKNDVEELELYSKLVRLSEPRWSADVGFAIIVFVACMTTATFLWSTKVSSTNIGLTAETESVLGDLTADWKLDPDSPLQAQSMRFEGLTGVQAPNVGLFVTQGPGDEWVSFEGGRISLELLQADKGATLHVVTDNDQVRIYFGGKPVRGRVSFTGEGKITAGEKTNETSLSKPYPNDRNGREILEFEVNNPQEDAFCVTIRKPKPWKLGRVSLASLSFAVKIDRDPREIDFVSGIKSGAIHFNDTSWQDVNLAESALVGIHATDQAAIAMSGSSVIHITVNGNVKGVTLGSSYGRKELAPSYLEYLYSNKPWHFFSAAVVFFWGILWGVRKTIFR